MTTSSQNGKGSRRRKGNEESYREGWERIFLDRSSVGLELVMDKIEESSDICKKILDKSDNFK